MAYILAILLFVGFAKADDVSHPPTATAPSTAEPQVETEVTPQVPAPQRLEYLQETVYDGTYMVDLVTAPAGADCPLDMIKLSPPDFTELMLRAQLPIEAHQEPQTLLICMEVTAFTQWVCSAPRELQGQPFMSMAIRQSDAKDLLGIHDTVVVNDCCGSSVDPDFTKHVMDMFLHPELYAVVRSFHEVRQAICR